MPQIPDPEQASQAFAGQPGAMTSPTPELAALDAVGAMVSYWDAGLRNRVANAAFRTFFGGAEGAIDGMRLDALLGPAVFADFEPGVRRALAGEVERYTRVIPLPDGNRELAVAYLPHRAGDAVIGFSIIAEDVTEASRARAAQLAAESRFRSLFQLAPIATVLLAPTGVVLDANRAAGQLLRRPTEQLVGVPITAFGDPQLREQNVRIFKALLHGDSSGYPAEQRHRLGDGGTLWLQVDATLMEGESGSSPLVLVQLQDISERRFEHAELEHLAKVDALTGVLNRRAFMEQLRATRSGALMLLDLDHFKAVNDALGHQAGDAVLTELAALLAARVREGDVIGRIGGDEFTLLLRDTTPEQAERLAEEIGERFEAARLGLPDQPVSLSAGVTAIDNTISPAELLDRADRAMYANKRARRTAAD